VSSDDCCGHVVGDALRMEYVSRAPQPPLDGLIHDVYYLAGRPPYRRLTLPAAPAPLLIVNLGAPFHVRAGDQVQAAEYADGCVVSTPTRAWEFGYPIPSRSVGVHLKPWGLAPFLPMAAAELRDRPATIEQVWGRPAVAELRDRLDAVHEPHQLLTVLEEGLMRQLRQTPGLDLVCRVSTAIAATGGTAPIGDLIAARGVSSTHLARSFKEIIGVTPKRLARAHRFSTTVLAMDPAEPIDWADLAARAGYFDQAHFGHEFREFTGFTPTRYVDLRRKFEREHPGHALDGWPLPAD
jgi:AraC-like DNA-binding protein